MSHHYKDYCWINGAPVGRGSPLDSFSGASYKIISDPYRKRISIEKYEQNRFLDVLYDSMLLDFRHIRQQDFTAWQKIPIQDSPQILQNLIVSQDDRVLFFETCRFQDDLCRECRIDSCHRLFLSTHKMFYTQFQDPFNGVVLYDKNDYPVMFKRYEFDLDTRQFGKLIDEQWDMQAHAIPALSKKSYA